MILVFCSVFAFLWIYLKLFPRPNRSKMILAVTVFSILTSFLVSVVSMYSVYWSSNPVFARLSLPFHLEAEWGPVLQMLNTGTVFFRIFFAGVPLWEMEFGTINTSERSYIHPPGQPDVNYTIPLFCLLVLIFTALNMVGAPLATLTYKLKIWESMKKRWEELSSAIARFDERARKNSLYRWLFPD
mgnify:FL=1